MGEPSIPTTPLNTTFLQAFEWNIPADSQHWKRLLYALPSLKAIGVDALWIPPACKAAGGTGSNGYDIYDLYDLGEFEQKGERGTKWGNKEELMELVNRAEDIGMGIYFDAVLNHKAGADRLERCDVVEVDPSNRTQEISCPNSTNAWLAFDFPGRGDTYSTQKWHWEHFSGIDYDAGNDRTGIFRILGEHKQWSNSVDDEAGNADFLMFSDIDYSHPEVCADVMNWGEWVVRECKLSGFRFDAVQHFSWRFMNEFVGRLNERFEMEKLFLVGEFWTGDVNALVSYLDHMEHKYSLFDAPLLNNFSRLSNSNDADLRTIFDNTLVKAKPMNAVTLVTNHDTQPGSTVETIVHPAFKALAYALILLCQDGYPQIFYGDLYGTQGWHSEPPSCNERLPHLILARKLYAYGKQEDYFDDPNCVGLVRQGTWDRLNGLACVISNRGAAWKRMFVGETHVAEFWTDLLGFSEKEVQIDEEGFGMFHCSAMSVSVFVNREAEGRDRFGHFHSNIYCLGT